MHTYFVIQAQSIGLWGDVFAVGCAVLNKERFLEEHYLACPNDHAEGLDEDRQWVVKHVMPHLPTSLNCNNPRELYEKVWQIWVRCKSQYPSLFCISFIGFPITMNLLGRAIKVNIAEREKNAPYPLFEIDTACLLTNYAVSTQTTPRMLSEQPRYHPLCDAKYYGRLFLLAMEHINTKGASFEYLSNRPLCGLDAKSRGLWGGIFYFGSVLYNANNNEEKGTWRTWRNPAVVDGLPKDDSWREPYLRELPQGKDCEDSKDLGEEVWKWVRLAQKSHAVFISWCPFSVDYRALAEAINVDIKKRQLKAPYPIHDTATALYLFNQDPIGTYERKPGEEKHGDPRGGARLAIRLFLKH